MNLFVHHLIDRHRQEGSVALVQPRPRARFEMERGDEALNDVSVPAKGDIGTAEPGPLPRLSGRTRNAVVPLKHNPQAEPAAVQEKQVDRKEPGRTGLHSVHGQGQRLIQGPSLRQAGDDADPESGTHDLYVEAVLQRLAGLIPKTGRGQTTETGHHDSIPAGVLGHRSDTFRHDHVGGLSTTKFEAPEQRQERKKNARPNQRSCPQPTGVLQPPPWLEQVQDSLRGQQGDRHKKDVGPVVNVTIGRIEIKAVRSGSAPPLARERKPRGVMSLDDYLRRREKRSRQ